MDTSARSNSHGIGEDGNLLTTSPRITARYQYYDRKGRPWCQHVKKEWLEQGERRKDMLWRHDNFGREDDWIWQRPPGVKTALYAPSNLGAARYMYVVEGEKDVNSLVVRGHWAATHPNGAGVGPNVFNARKVVKAWRSQPRHSSRPIRIVIDRDEAGAYNAWRWYVLLVDAMEDDGPIEDPHARPRVVRACGPLHAFKDVTDHLAAGQGVDALIPVPVDDVREWARPEIEKRERAKRKRDERNRWKSPAELFNEWAESDSPARKLRTGYKPGRRVGV